MVGQGGSRLLVALLALTSLAPIALADGVPEALPVVDPAPPPPTAPEPGVPADDREEDAHEAVDSLSSVERPGRPDARTIVTAAQEAAAKVATEAARAKALANNLVVRVRSLLPEDPLGVIGQQVDPVRKEAEHLLTGDPPADDEESRIETQQVAADVQSIPDNLLIAGTLVVAGTATAVLVGVWVASTSSVGGAAGSAGAARSALDLRRLLPIASPLFTRFEKGTVLGHPKREALYALILQEPGISLQALGERLNLSRTAVTHHLRLLEHQHLVVSRRVGRGRHYYENGGRYGHDQKEAYALLRNERSRAVATFIRDHPGAIQRELCESLGLGASIAHWHVERLREASLVETVRRGRTVAYYPAAAMQECLVPAVGALADSQPNLPVPVSTPAVARPAAALLVAAALPQ